MNSAGKLTSEGVQDLQKDYDLALTALYGGTGVAWAADH